MTRRNKVVLAIVLAAVGAAAVGGVFFRIASLDCGSPDDSDLRVAWEDIADEANGFPVMVRAAGKASWPENADARRLQAILSGRAWDDALVRRLLEENREALALLEEAAARPHFQFPPLSLHTPGPPLYPWRQLARAGRLRAAALARDGRHGEALQEAVRLVRLGHRIERGKGNLVQHLTGSQVKQTGAQALIDLLPRLALPPELLKACAKDLAAYPADGAGMADACRSEYMMIASAIDDLRDGRAAPLDLGLGDRTMGSYTFQPNRTKRLFAADWRYAVRNAARPLADVEPFVPQVDPETPAVRLAASQNGVGRMLYVLMCMSCEGTLKGACVDRARLEAARLLVTLKACKAQTGGLPESLKALVPEWIDAVPADPCDGKPLRYDPAKRLVWSVGRDLKDDGGTASNSRGEGDEVFAIEF